MYSRWSSAQPAAPSISGSNSSILSFPAFAGAFDAGASSSDRTKLSASYHVSSSANA